MVVVLFSIVLIVFTVVLLGFAMLRCGGYDKMSFAFLGALGSLALFACFGALLTG